MEEQDLLHLTLPGYILGLHFCCRILQRGGVCIFVRNDLYFNEIDITHNSREKDLEICAVEIETKANKLIIFCLYRGPTGDLNQFIKHLDDTFKLLYKLKAEFLICGDINTDYFIESNWKKQSPSLLTTYILPHTVNFATRIQNDSNTAIDNIFVDNSRLKSPSTSPLINGLSDHDAQFLTINKQYICNNKQNSFQAKDQINK
jgi:exonuclease III